MNDNGEDLPAVVPPGPDNPLGKYEFRLGWPSYLIHGTNKPYGVGLRSSHGCVRLYPEDIEKAVPDGAERHARCGWSISRSCSAGTTASCILQAYTVLEDDKRDWQQCAEETAVAGAVASARAGSAASPPAPRSTGRASPRSRTRRAACRTGRRARAAAVDAVLAAAPKVQNRIPEASNWDGKDDTGSDGKSAQQLLSEREPSSAPAPASHAPGG